MQNSSCYKKTKHAIFSEKRTFLNPRTCVDQGVSKKCSFFEKFGVLCFLVTPVLRFALFCVVLVPNIFVLVYLKEVAFSIL